ncbi:hypothetical protein BS78_K339300 [Paspalum vaginatum]|uniref:Uncharacterized protein n=1 Tax=Paspalum vaginatum TaxID=158149 RepID=A0A9W7XAY3_9POAL|nr:hypothetical protein BS78_K339300 [Paspalum vaginatum]
MVHTIVAGAGHEALGFHKRLMFRGRGWQRVQVKDFGSTGVVLSPVASPTATNGDMVLLGPVPSTTMCGLGFKRCW